MSRGHTRNRSRSNSGSPLDLDDRIEARAQQAAEVSSPFIL